MSELPMTAKPELARDEMVYVFVLAIAAVVLGAAIFYAYDWYTMDRFTMSTNDFLYRTRQGCSQRGRHDCTFGLGPLRGLRASPTEAEAFPSLS